MKTDKLSLKIIKPIVLSCLFMKFFSAIGEDKMPPVSVKDLIKNLESKKIIIQTKDTPTPMAKQTPEKQVSPKAQVSPKKQTAPEAKIAQKQTTQEKAIPETPNQIAQKALKTPQITKNPAPAVPATKPSPKTIGKPENIANPKTEAETEMQKFLKGKSITKALPAAPTEKKVVVIGKNKVIDEYLDQKECSICLEEHTDNDELAKLPCGHIYHNKCVSGWIEADYNALEQEFKNSINQYLINGSNAAEPVSPKLNKNTCPYCRREIIKTLIEKYVNELINSKSKNLDIKKAKEYLMKNKNS